MLAKKSTRTQEVREALRDADAVIVARLRYSTLTTDTTYPSVIIEDAEFEILEVFKGELKPGQLILVHQIVSGGSCALSSSNDPPWLTDIEKGEGDKDPVEVPMTLSKEWLIYAYGSDPYELGRCTRTMPLNVEGDKDAGVLRNLINKGSRTD